MSVDMYTYTGWPCRYLLWTLHDLYLCSQCMMCCDSYRQYGSSKTSTYMEVFRTAAPAHFFCNYHYVFVTCMYAPSYTPGVSYTYLFVRTAVRLTSYIAFIFLCVSNTINALSYHGRFSHWMLNIVVLWTVL